MLVLLEPFFESLVLRALRLPVRLLIHARALLRQPLAKLLEVLDDMVSITPESKSIPGKAPQILRRGGEADVTLGVYFNAERIPLNTLKSRFQLGFFIILPS